MKEAILYEQLPDARVRCNCCLWRCVIAPGKRGVCRTRENSEGKLYTLIYDRVSSACVDPIEKKPLYHFYPRTRVFSLGTLGCSFACPGCQNWQISQRAPLEDDPSLTRMTPAEGVEMAIAQHAQGICWTYNDPAIWIEHTLEGARLAKDRGLYTAYVTNATATHEHLDTIGPYLDAYRVDIKAFTPEAYQAVSGRFSNVAGIFDGVKYAKERWGMHVECVTNVTPTINDSDEELAGIANWIATDLGPDTPWHVTKFYPYLDLSHLPPTPMERIDRAYEIGRAAGLRYVYVGNVPGDPRQDTHCPHCDRAVIQRSGYNIAVHMTDGHCPQCGEVIAGVWG